MAPRVAGIPQYRERAALQTIKYRSWVPQTALHPAGEGTIAIMLKKGWIERQLGPGGEPPVIERIAQSDARHGFVLDGFPRTISQAVTFDDLLHTEGVELDHVIELHVDEEVLLDRIVTRAREAAQAGGAVRTDDNHEALKVRIDAYREQTAPLIDYYRSRNVLKSVDGLQPVDSVTEQIFQIMERRQRAIGNTVAEQANSGRPG